MTIPLEYTTEIGPHDGWTTHYFECLGRPWKLLLIEGEGRKTSMICAQDNKRDAPWAHYNHFQFEGIITPLSAVAIISRIYNAYGAGIAAGEMKQRMLARQVFGL